MAAAFTALNACLICSTIGSGCSPMNLSVTCNDSGFTHRAWGSESADAVDEARDLVADGVVDVEGDEEAHESRESGVLSREHNESRVVSPELRAIGLSRK